MGKLSIQVMGDSGGNLNLTTDKVRASGWSGYSSPMMTVSLGLNNFKGRIYIQGTLADNPNEDDWFNLHLSGATDYVQYPRDNSMTNVTYTDSFSFSSNLIYIRVKLDRSYITPTPTIYQVGNVKKILLSY